MKKLRLDRLLVERGLAASRERAQALILAGKVLVDEQKVEKAGASVGAEAKLRMLGEDLKYVSRGGVKLEAALEHWRVEVTDRVCLDVGASTGGFTDCLLQRGAGRVIAVDTGYGQMDSRLRSHPRVRLLERTNARYLKPEDVGERVEMAVMDVAFISATLVLPAVVRSCIAAWERGRDARATPGGKPALLELVVLVKPQFEVGREKVGKGGIVRDADDQQAAVEKVRRTVEALGGTEIEVMESPITGAEGNREFLLHARFHESRGK
ncbi:MAG TPA: TlyA family RNA methyltransferase [Terriglobales bacterium]|nr:TlyA family RNA methyltransferase [Terriglobales bacterium]